MPRARYPSDERRLRTKPHVRVHTSVKHHPKTAKVWAKPKSRGMLVELWRIGREAGAGFTGNQVVLTRGDVKDITGHERYTVGAKTVRRLCTDCAYSVHEVDGELVVTIRNFAKKNGLHSADRGASATLEQEQEQEQVEESSAPQSSRSKTPRKMATSPEAIDFAERFRKALKGRTPDAKMPSGSAFARWIEAADRMYRIDKRTPTEAIELATWLFSDPGDQASFWRANCRAVPKFRTRFEELREHRARGQQKGKRDGGIRGAATSLARRRGLVGSGTGEADPAIRGDARRLPSGEESGS